MSKNTIKLKRYNDIVNEYPAAEDILPGAVVSLKSDGTVENNDDNGKAVSFAVALENELLGKTIEDKYTAGDVVQCWVATPGEEVLVQVTSGTDPAIGDYLEAATAGSLKAVASGVPLAVVVGAKETDDDGNGRVPVRVI